MKLNNSTKISMLKNKDSFKRKKEPAKKRKNPKKKEQIKKKEKKSIKEKKISNEEKPISNELLERLLEEKGKQNTEINNFLANPWKTVSLENMNSSPVSNLEKNLPRIKTSSEEDKDNIDYTLFKNVKEEQYQSPTVSDEFKEIDLDEKERSFKEQKRFYEKMKILSPELKQETHPGIKYIKPEDNIKKDYLTKKKFF